MGRLIPKIRYEQFVDLILPLAVPGQFTYGLPADVETPLPGMRVAVPFGRGGKLYSALVRRVHSQDPGHTTVRPILSVLDSKPIVSQEQLDLWERMSEYYLCTIGEVMIAALPAQLAINSETRLVASPQAAQEARIKGRGSILLQALLAREVLTLAEAGELMGLKDPMPAIKRLMDQGALLLEEELRDTWKPRLVTYVTLQPAAQDEEALHGWFDTLAKAPKQQQLLMRYVELSRCMSDEPREVERSKLVHLSGSTNAVVTRLVEKGLFSTYTREEGLPSEEETSRPPLDLSKAQSKALESIRTEFQTKDVVLLKGVTSSGKTEVYSALMEEALQNGKQVLYLLPEIALTTQIISRLRARFGDRVSVFHSRMSQHERTALWLRCVQGDQPPPIIVGARSALFLPYRDLGLVVVDEEHDPSYKQQDPAPRYNARDMSIWLAAAFGGKVLLGSATPSMESQHNARNGKFGFVELNVRFGDVSMPEILRVDLRDSAKRKLMHGHFTSTLVDSINAALARREQVILFQNRRGYVPVWQCESCSWVPECTHCDVSLTYHKRAHQLRCHYCGAHYQPPTQCGQCGSARLKMIGLGTEKIEEEIGEFFPHASVSRMDQDTTRGKQALDRILTSFGQGAVDILVGTQMVTKGLDFDNVSVVGILNADKLLKFPDFRAHERGFQLMAQVAGRSGRRNTPGRVIIQAQDIGHPVLDLVVHNDVDGMYKRELEHRLAHGYPPFTRLIQITLKHRNEERVAETAFALAAALREGLGERVLGPEIPMVSRIRDKHLRRLLVKIRRKAHGSEKAFVRDTIDRVFAQSEHRAVQLVADVDPQ